MTLHKSQGQTLSTMVIDLGNSIQIFHSHLLQQNTIYFIRRKKIKRAEQLI